jgi:hypothetical protein
MVELVAALGRETDRGDESPKHYRSHMNARMAAANLSLDGAFSRRNEE